MTNKDFQSKISGITEMLMEDYGKGRVIDEIKNFYLSGWKLSGNGRIGRNCAFI